jgi:hypothetical protein
MSIRPLFLDEYKAIVSGLWKMNQTQNLLPEGLVNKALMKDIQHLMIYTELMKSLKINIQQAYINIASVLQKELCNNCVTKPAIFNFHGSN